MKCIDRLITHNRNVHIFARILRSTRAETVQAKTVAVHTALVVVIFTAGIKLAVNQLPVVSALGLVVVKGNTASVVAHLDRAVHKARNLN